MGSKRIALLTVGTRGDVQPFAALGLGLKSAGYEVLLAAPANFRSWIERLGLAYAEGMGDFRDFMADPRVKRIIDSGPLSNLGQKFSLGREFYEKTARKAFAAAEHADAIIFHPKMSFAIDIAEARRVPIIMAALQPFTSTRAFPFLAITRHSLGGTLNKATYAILRATRLSLAGVENKLREELLDLPPVSRFSNHLNLNGQPIPVIYGFSKHVQPRPHDWPAQVHIAGYWFLQDPNAVSWQPNDELARFLASGKPPIYIGFGSMPVSCPTKVAGLLAKSLEETDLRAVIARGWGGLGEADILSDRVHLIDSAPHQHLFPHMAGVVHHGGAGTTAAGLRAGRPTLVCPFMVDQPYWGGRIEALGAGPAPLHIKQWRDDRMSDALHALTTITDYRRAALAVAQLLQSEDGVARAVELVKTIVGNP